MPPSGHDRDLGTTEPATAPWPAVPVAGTPNAAAWSPDETALAVGTSDGRVVVWDVTTRSLRRIWQAHQSRISTVSWSDDGLSLSTTTDHATSAELAVWESASGALISRAAVDTPRALASAWSADRRQLAIARHDRPQVAIWNVEARTLTTQIDIDDHEVSCLSWSPDGQFFVTGSTEGAESPAVIWGVLTGDRQPLDRLFPVSSSALDPVTGEATVTFTHEQLEVTAISWSPAGDLIAIAGANEAGPVDIWDLTTNSVRVELYTAYGPAALLAWSPSGDRLAVGTWAGDMSIWSRESGAETFAHRHVETITLIAWSRDATQLATASVHGEVALAVTDEIGERATASQLIGGHTGWLMDVMWSPAGDRLVSASRSATFSEWNTDTGEWRRRFSAAHDEASRLWTVDWSPGRDRVVVVGLGATNRVSIWDLESGAQTGAFTADIGWVSRAAWSPDGSQLAVAGTGAFAVWTPATATETVVPTRPEAIHCLAWSPDGQRIALGYRDGELEIWDPAAAARLARTSAHTSRVTAVDWSPDAGWLATGSLDSTLAIWEIDRAIENTARHAFDDPISRIAWSADGARLAAAVGERLVLVDMTTFEAVRGDRWHSVGVHGDEITAIRWSPDGTQIATTSIDGTVAILARSSMQVARRFPLLPAAD